MSIKEKIAASIIINIIIYAIFSFWPCENVGFADWCSDGLFQPLGFLMAFALQFGIIFNLFEPGYYLSFGLKEFPKITLSVLIWLIILSPFYVHKIVNKFSRSHHT